MVSPLNATTGILISFIPVTPVYSSVFIMKGAELYSAPPLIQHIYALSVFNVSYS